MTRRSLLEEGFWDQKLTAPWTDVPLERDQHGIEWEKGARRRNPDRVRARLEQAIDHWIEQAREIPSFDELAPPIPRPRTVFDLRGATAGMAVTERSLLGEADQWIRVHSQLLVRYPVRMIQQTIPHEVAHLVIDWYLPQARATRPGVDGRDGLLRPATAAFQRHGRPAPRATEVGCG